VLPRRPVDEHVECLAEEPVTPRRRHPPGHLEQPRVAARLDLVGHLVLHRRRRRAGPTRVAEGEDVVVADPLDHVERLLEVRLGLARETHDQVRRERHRGLRVADLADELEVALARVAAVHPLEHGVRARLERQVKVLAHLRHLPQRADEPGREVVRVGGGEPDPLDPRDVVDPLEERGQVGRRRQVAPVGVDRLAEERHLAAPHGGEAPHLRQDRFGRVAALPPPGARRWIAPCWSCAMHPMTPMISSGLRSLSFRSSPSFEKTLSSAFSRIAQVLTRIRSASSSSWVSSQRFSRSKPATRSESYSFIWQPYVIRWSLAMSAWKIPRLRWSDRSTHGRASQTTAAESRSAPPFWVPDCSIREPYRGRPRLRDGSERLTDQRCLIYWRA